MGTLDEPCRRKMGIQTLYENLFLVRKLSKAFFNAQDDGRIG
jgi:hypothetical protein